MKPRFVILGSMRTGSNFLASLLNQVDGVICHGEVFNSGHVGLLKELSDLLGIQRKDVAKRDDDIEVFFDKVVKDNPDNITGFRMFGGHHPHALDRVLADKQFRRIMLKRDILVSFVSYCQAMESGVWMINSRDDDAKSRKRRQQYENKIWFEPHRYETYKKKVNTFHRIVEEDAASRGVPIFEIWYRDLQDPEKIGELLDFIGVKTGRPLFEEFIVKQTTSDLEGRVENFGEMLEYLSRSERQRPIISAKSGRYSVQQEVVMDLVEISPEWKESIRSGQYESQEARILQLTLSPDDRILELGSGIGFIGILAKKIYPDMSVFAFEGNPELIPLIRRNQVLNKCEFEVVNAILGRSPGVVSYFLTEHFLASPAVTKGERGGAVQIEVQAQDVVLARCRPDYLVVDLEKAGADIFEFLDLSSIKKILVELHPGKMGEEVVSRVVRQIKGAGFLLNSEISNGQVSYFYQPIG